MYLKGCILLHCNHVYQCGNLPVLRVTSQNFYRPLKDIRCCMHWAGLHYQLMFSIFHPWSSHREQELTHLLQRAPHLGICFSLLELCLYIIFILFGRLARWGFMMVKYINDTWSTWGCFIETKQVFLEVGMDIYTILEVPRNVTVLSSNGRENYITCFPLVDLKEWQLPPCGSQHRC